MISQDTLNWNKQFHTQFMQNSFCTKHSCILSTYILMIRCYIIVNPLSSSIDSFSNKVTQCIPKCMSQWIQIYRTLLQLNASLRKSHASHRSPSFSLITYTSRGFSNPVAFPSNEHAELLNNLTWHALAVVCKAEFTYFMKWTLSYDRLVELFSYSLEMCWLLT